MGLSHVDPKNITMYSSMSLNIFKFLNNLVWFISKFVNDRDDRK